MAEDPNVKTKQNSVNVAAIQQSVARIENDAVFDDGFNAAAKPTNNSTGAVFSAPITGASWQVRTSYDVLNGTPSGRFEIYGPRVYSNGKFVTIGNCGSNGWLSLDNIVTAKPASSGTLAARFVLAVTKTKNEDETESVTKKLSSCNIVFREDGEQTPAATESTETVDMDICYINTSAIKPINQIHTGVLTFSGEVSAGGSGASIGTAAFCVGVYKFGDQIWLAQGKPIKGADGEFSTPTKILRIDNIGESVGIGATKESLATSGSTTRYVNHLLSQTPTIVTPNMENNFGNEVYFNYAEWRCYKEGAAGFRVLLEETYTKWIGGLCIISPENEMDLGDFRGQYNWNGFFTIPDSPTQEGDTEVYFYTEVAYSNKVEGAIYSEVTE